MQEGGRASNKEGKERKGGRRGKGPVSMSVLMGRGRDRYRGARGAQIIGPGVMSHCNGQHGTSYHPQAWCATCFPARTGLEPQLVHAAEKQFELHGEQP